MTSDDIIAVLKNLADTAKGSVELGDWPELQDALDKAYVTISLHENDTGLNPLVLDTEEKVESEIVRVANQIRHLKQFTTSP